MDWSKGFSAQYYASIVDAGTWKSIERFEIKGGSIKRTGSGLMQSGDIDCTKFRYGEKWVRIYLITRQGGNSATLPLFTGLSSCPDDDIHGYRIDNSVELYSALKPCQDVLLPRGYYVPAGSNGADVIKRLLRVTPAPVVVEGTSPSPASHIVSEDGENHLTMAQKVLAGINWRMKIDGDGTIRIMPVSRDPVVAYNPFDNDCLETEIKITYDWYSAPNVFRAVEGDAYAEARDDDPKSPFSTVNRGREIWMEETSVHLNTGETLAQYAVRRLKEEQSVSMTASYDRRFHPDVQVSDVVSHNYPAQGLVGNYMVTSQSIELSHGARTSEEVIKV